MAVETSSQAAVHDIIKKGCYFASPPFAGCSFVCDRNMAFIKKTQGKEFMLTNNML